MPLIEGIGRSRLNHPGPTLKVPVDPLSTKMGIADGMEVGGSGSEQCVFSFGFILYSPRKQE
jgi:hypothetical protein